MAAKTAAMGPKATVGPRSPGSHSHKGLRESNTRRPRPLGGLWPRMGHRLKTFSLPKSHGLDQGHTGAQTTRESQTPGCHGRFDGFAWRGAPKCLGIQDAGAMATREPLPPGSQGCKGSGLQQGKACWGQRAQSGQSHQGAITPGSDGRKNSGHQTRQGILGAEATVGP